MSEKILSMTNDMTQSITMDPAALLTTSTINALHFPDLTTSGISESGGGRTMNLNLDGIGMCESMTESYCSVTGQDETFTFNNQNDTLLINTQKNLGKKDSLNAQKKRRSRKAQYDASTDGILLDRIESVHINDEQNDADDTWLYQVPISGNKISSPSENIFSWVHKEFKENDINATKHRLLCKLDDMSNARTIRSISCHNFADNQRSDSVKRSSTEQQVNQELLVNDRLSSPMRTPTPQYNVNTNTRPTSPAHASPLRHTIASTGASVNYANNIHSRDTSRERERHPLDYTDLEVMAKVQLENLRQADRQGPLSKRFGGSTNTLLTADSRDVSPSPVFGGTRNTSPVGNNGGLTPRQSHSPNSLTPAGRIPIRKNSFVVTESQYAHVLPSVSPRSSSPAIRTGQWSGRVTPSALETCMETSYISTSPPQSFRLHNNTENISFVNNAQGGSNVSLASTGSATNQNMTNKPPVAPKSGLVPRNGTKPNNHRRSNTQTITTNVSNSFDLPDVTDPKPPTSIAATRTSVNSTANNRVQAPTARTIQSYRGAQTALINNNNNSKIQRTVKKPTNDLGSTYTARQFSSNEKTLLNDVSNKPLGTTITATPNRTQVNFQRRSTAQSSVEQIPSSTSANDMNSANNQTSIPRSVSTFSQMRRSGIPTIGKQQRAGIPTATRPTSSTTFPSSQSSDNMMATRNIRPQTTAIVRPKISEATSPTSSWNEGCY